MTICDVAKIIETFAPLSYQESYDNAGLIVGSPDAEVTGAVICLDVTDRVMERARELGANLVISHHPLVFNAMKKITGATRTERIVIEAIKSDIAIYACHTNLDSVAGGVSYKMAQMLGLTHIETLEPRGGDLVKIVMFAPNAYAEAVRAAMFEAGAGSIGAYDSCSFNTRGDGTFRAMSGTSPFVGSVGVLHTEQETKIEVIAPRHLSRGIINSARRVHPYEEVAYDIFSVENLNPKLGFGAVGNLAIPQSTDDFLRYVKQTFNLKVLRHTEAHTKMIHRVALCGGSGGSLVERAAAARADIYITGDLKFSDFFRGDNRIIIADIGHFESEICAIDILFEILKKNFVTFALHKCDVCTNPIIYSV